MKLIIDKILGVSHAPFAVIAPPSLPTESSPCFFLRDSARQRPAVGKNFKRLLYGLVVMPWFALASVPLIGQAQSNAPEGQRVMLLKHLDENGQEVVERQPLEKGEAMVIERQEGKIVSTQVIKVGDGQRIIIKFKDKSLVQQFGQGLAKSNMLSAQQQMNQVRENFSARLVSAENQHRSVRGLTAVAAPEVIIRDYNYCFHGLAARVQPETVAEIRNMPEVESVYPDRQRSKFDGYGISQIGAPRVWQDLGVTGRGIKIAIIDTGIDYLHPDLGGGIGASFKVLGGYDFVNHDGDPMDDNGHGTHVAGIAAANGQIRGVAPDASLFAIKVLDAFGNGWDSDIISGVEWAVANGANIINMSLGGPGDPDDPLSQTVDQATQAGVLVVTAAGNFPGYNTIGSPAAARTALAVGADDNTETIAFFSSRGPAPITYQIKPELVAPGVGIYSTVPFSGTQLSNPTGYLSLSGTSMAAPHVAGAAALLMQKYPLRTPQQVELALMEGALDIYQDVMTQGSGEVDVYNSATSPLLSTGAELSLGWDDIRLPFLNSSQLLTVTNTSGTATQISLTLQHNLPASVQVTVSPAGLSLQPGESKTVNFSVIVNNATTPNLPALPFTYSGMVVATNSTGASIHRPFAFCKAPRLRIAVDDVLDSVGIFRGSQLVQTLSRSSVAPIDMLLPAGRYDFLFEFSPFAHLPVVNLTNVVREMVDVSTLTELSVSTAEAKNRLELKLIDAKGGSLTSDFSDYVSVVTHQASGVRFFKELAGLSVESSNHTLISNLSGGFKWDASFAALPNDPATPVYAFHASAHQGVAHSKAFTFKPEDLNKTVLYHSIRSDNNPFKLRNWLWEILPGSGGLGSGSETTFSSTSVEQAVYSIPSGDPDELGGFWSVDEVGLNHSGNLSFLLPDAFEKTLAFRPVKREVLAGYDYLHGTEIFRTGARRFLLGQGPVHWSGSMHNSPDFIRIQTSSTQKQDQKLFSGQSQEEIVHGLLSYTLAQHGSVVAAGTLDSAMRYIPGLIIDNVVEMSVAPGAYDLAIPFNGFFMHDAPGKLEVRNQFDTTRSDPNPPSLTGYQLVNPFDLLQQNPFLDAVPLLGAELRIGVDDDVGVKDAKLSFQEGTAWFPLPLLKVDQKHYSAYIPWLGFNRDAINLKLIVSDTSDNALTLTETIPYVKK